MIIPVGMSMQQGHSTSNWLNSSSLNCFLKTCSFLAFAISLLFEQSTDDSGLPSTFSISITSLMASSFGSLFDFWFIFLFLALALKMKIMYYLEGENCNTLSARFGLELLEWIILSYSDTLGSNPCLISTSSTKKGVKMKHYLPFDLVALMLNVAEGW